MKIPSGKTNTAPPIAPGAILPAPAIGPLAPRALGPAPAAPVPARTETEDAQPAAAPIPGAPPSAAIPGIRGGLHPAIWASGLFAAFALVLWLFVGR